MVCPTLISVSLVPGPYCFWASAGCASRIAIAAPSGASFLTNIGFLHISCCGGSVGQARGAGKPMQRRAPCRSAMRSAREPRSARVPLGGLFRRLRPGADRLLGGRRLDAERPADIDPGDGGFRLLPEEYAATRTELRFIPDHADRDAVDIGNFRTAKAHGVAAAGLLLLGSVGPACGRPDRDRKRRRQHQTELELPGPDSHY